MLNHTPQLTALIKFHNDDEETKKRFFQNCTCAASGGEWIDLPTVEDTTLKKGEMAYLPLGFSMQLPRGYEAHITARSSTLERYGVLIPLGIIDNAYNGEGDQWHCIVYATRDTEILRGDCVCQFRLYENQPILDFFQVEELANEDRGGFGSTGR